ncbi:sucrose-phosphate synthase [Zea mays]|uniref:Sucrose-phosphate synthase n=2 Tax=Zea mays TaxID=4577 RepID=SPSA_MAIZE|nr:sucrose-phosphate synthase [Zea mays]P31927.1 RecName: Full=Sucrose-phosphate synthase; AltName: Full=UDP-glucose-fructose-phosphate glucosyltransferase [Zea mays]AAA33513.1 sucrose phosphate synthase [Zea mays]AQK98683.1 Sucrose-phosphate synthase [Zea mays]|eukprot:NP_001105694.1 sucrose-phosphate synthase [Zea mays]
MAGNEWINGYLEAILDSHTSSRGAGGGGGGGDPRSPTKAASPRGAHMNFNPSHYFVEEVVKGVDESDLHRTWIKVVATRNARERSTRLENMCWRIWHLARKKKQLELEGIQRISARRKEQEQVRREATEDLAEDLSEGEKGDTIGELAPVETTKKKFQRNFSDLTVWSDDNKEKKLYIVLISVHGLVRGENMELGRDSDTGGQVKYVVELARAMSMMPGVYRVDLFTRQVSSPDVDWSYGEPTEMLCAGSNDGEGMGESGGAYIVRIPCGPRDKYLKKEALWPYLQEFVDGALAHILNMSKALGEQVGNGRPVLPYVIHGHYADAGDVAALLSGALNVPMVLTGHSLGRNKLEQLLKQGRMSKEEIDSTYKIMRRIEGEELALDASELVITSTRQEIDEQWGLYDGFDVKLEKVLRARARRGVSCHGRYMPRMVVIPPGMDFSNVVVHEDIDGDGDVKDDIVGLEGASPKSMPPIWAEVMRFLTNPHKPMILALSRPDPKKNITTLVKAFGECRPLRELANLTLIMGNRDDIDDMSAGNASVLTTVLKLIDKYDLYGSVAFPKHHNQADVPEIYRLAAKMKGVFINPALVEPFGLTLIEAAAHGLPIVATKNGGPVDITNALNNGLLVDPHDQNAIADALLKLVADKNLWQECRRNGLRNIHLYSWPEHCRTYLTRVAGCRLRNPRWLKDTPADAGADEEEFLEDSMDAQDLSLRLSIDGEKSSLNTNDPLWFDPQDQVQKIMNNIKQSSALPPSMSSVAAEGTGSTMNKYPLLRRRRRLFVIAVDCYQDDGRASKKMLQVIQEVFRAVRSDSQMFKISGFTLSTAMPLSETLQLLQLGKIPATDFDALICGSGSEVYYPGTANCMDAEGKLRPDQDYLMHISHRWSHDGARQTIAKLMGAQDGSGDAVEQDVASSNAHCVAFLIKDPQKVKTVDEMRERLRMRGLRCHIMYCRNSTRLQVVPLLASRSQALRYLSVRWGVSVGNMYLITGEHGDTDLEEMLSGLHKTVIVRGVTEKGSEALVRSPGSYKRDDVVPSETPLAAYTTGELKADEIMRALKQVSKTSSGM